MADGYDAIVVGGGHNGLVAACFLARERLRVLVVEQNEAAGGMAATLPLFDRAGPAYLANPGAYENVYLRAGGVVEELELRRFGYREVDAAGWGWVGGDGTSLLLQRDVEATVREIGRHSAADAARYRELVAVGVKALAIQDRYGAGHPARPGWRTLGAIARTLAGDRALRSMLGALATGTAADAIASTFESEPVRGIFAGTASIMGAPTSEGSALGMLGPALLHHKGAARPIGGMGGVIAALTACLRSHGGELRTGARAARIHAEGGRAGAVELADGTVLRARRAVLSAIPPQRLPELVGDALEPRVAQRLRAAPANAAGVGTFTVNVALGGRLELPAHARPDGADLRRPALFGGTLEETLAAYGDCCHGQLPAGAVPWVLTIFTAMDPSQAPEGHDVAQLYGPAPVRGWTDERRDALAQRLVDAVARVAPALGELELDRHVESPADLSARVGVENGCIYHVDHLPTRLGPLRPALGAGGYRLPLPGLYLTGVGSHPGGGISGLPGRSAARTLLRDLSHPD